MPLLRPALVAVASVAMLTAGCTARAPVAARSTAADTAGTVVVRDTLLPGWVVAHGVAAPVARAVLATKLMATVRAVHVHVGDRVRGGQRLAELDVRELAARQAQAAAGTSAADAMLRDAEVQAARMRALYADSAATRVQLEAAETGLARARAGAEAARAMHAEAAAVGSYGRLQAPFDGIITERWVDPGALAAPGAPLLALEDQRRLRLSARVPIADAAGLGRGRALEATVEGVPVRALVEGVVPAPGGGVSIVSAIAENPGGRLPSGGAVTLRLPAAARTVVLVPAGAVQVQGDLASVQVAMADGPALRWVRTGAARGTQLEILSGLRAGERILVAAAPAP